MSAQIYCISQVYRVRNKKKAFIILRDHAVSSNLDIRLYKHPLRAAHRSLPLFTIEVSIENALITLEERLRGKEKAVEQARRQNQMETDSKHKTKRLVFD